MFSLQGTARTSTELPAQIHTPSTIGPPRLVQPPAAESPLSEGIAAFLARQEQEGAAQLTIRGYRETGWSLFEFLRCDPPLRELNQETLPRWLDWLRSTPIYRRKRGAYPPLFSRKSVSAFLAWPGAKRSLPGGKPRSNATVTKKRIEAASMLRWLKVPVEIERRKRRTFHRLPPIVPHWDGIAARWQSYLACGRVSPAHCRQVVLTQALILLWGVRLSEALTAALEDVEGHWVLCTGKTGMRLGYLNSQALGLVQALRGQTAWDWAAQRHTRVAAWPWTANKWHSFVRDCRVDDGDKPQQDLRRRFSSWVQPRDADVEKLLAGHGGGVIFNHYLDTLRRVPPVMEEFCLPAVEGFVWPQPVYVHRPSAWQGAWGAAEEAAAAAAQTPPRQLYARFDAWLAEQERRASQ